MSTGVDEMCEECSKEFTKLSGFRVVVGVTGSISVYRTPDLIRDLIREGAEVKCGLSEAARELVSEEVFTWASKNRAITHVSGQVEHITFFDHPEKTVFLVAPATYDFIGKIASGIADTVPTLFFSYAFGHKVPVIVAPAMHESMMKNPVLVDNMEKLHSLGVTFVQPRIEEGKAKISDSSYLVDSVYRAFYGSAFQGKRALVIAGHGEEAIDPVRVLSNRASGKTGYWLARNLYRLGCEKIKFIGNSTEPVPSYVDLETVTDRDLFYSTTLQEVRDGDYDYIFLPAALPDFTIEYSKTKIKSGKPITLDLSPRKKLLSEVKEIFNGKIVSFKLDHEEPGKEETDDFVVFNRIREAGGNFGDVPVEYTVVGKTGRSKVTASSKEEGTWKILRHVSREGQQ